ncbi:MAG: hypothetical protein EA341_11740 [Mongoliibacter sp.]|nr:MAG: hypothetical protein EA341_11740 [Mongoliibacter sp.]
MRSFCVTLFLISMMACISDNDESNFGKRRVVGQINNELAFLALEEITNSRSSGFVFELQDPGEFTFLSALDKSLICDSLPDQICLDYHKNYLKHIVSVNDTSPRWLSPRLWYRISGYVKEFNSIDNIVGNPFIVTKAERVLSCPVIYEVKPKEVSIIDTFWKFVGFIDNEDVIYSHPTCEFNNESIRFTSSPVSNYSQIEGHMDFETGNLKSFFWTLSFSIDTGNSQIIIKTLPNPYGGNGKNNFYDPIRTAEIANKADSIARLIGNDDTLSYFLKNNVLKLHNSRNKLRALFVAE